MRFLLAFITRTSRERHIVSNHWSFNCLFNSLYGPTCKKHQSMHYWPFVGEFPAQRTSNAEKASMSWLQHVTDLMWSRRPFWKTCHLTIVFKIFKRHRNFYENMSNFVVIADGLESPGSCVCIYICICIYIYIYIYHIYYICVCIFMYSGPILQGSLTTFYFDIIKVLCIISGCVFPFTRIFHRYFVIFWIVFICLSNHFCRILTWALDL